MNLIASFERVDDDLPVHLRDASGDLAYHEGEPVRVWVMSVEDKRFKRIDSELTNRLEKAKNPTQELRSKIGTEKIARWTTKFENIYYPGEDKPVECTFDTALKLYKDVPDILAQVADFYADRRNFLASRQDS